MTIPLCAASGFPIPEGCPTVAHVVVRRRDGSRWSPLGFGFRGLQSGPDMLSDVEGGPLTDYTRKLLSRGLRRRDGISHSLPRDVEPGMIGRLLAENRLCWDSGHSSAVLVEHRVGVMRIRADVHRTLVSDMSETTRGMGLLTRARDVMAALREMRAEPRDPDGNVPWDRALPMADGLTKARDAMGPSSALLADNQALVDGPNEPILFDAVLDVMYLDAALDAVGSGWRPSRTADAAHDARHVARFHAEMAKLIEDA